jgi:SOS-response transcriptional repressor LexA
MAHIEATFARFGRAPTIREICAATNLSSTDTVQGHVETLIREGYLTRTTKNGRILRLTAKRYFTG